MAQIKVMHLTFAYEGSYDNIFENVSFQMDTNWKLGFTGRNGRGKTTFLQLLMGKHAYEGTISANVAFDYFPFPVENQEQDTLAVVEEICPGVLYWQLQRELSRLALEEEVLYRPFWTMSNGQQTKVLLAALFLKDNHFLLIDEPTNHLDLDGRAVVSNYLDSKRGFILVSHDRAFLDQCVDHVLSINKTNIEIQKGNFTSWYQNKELRDQFELAENERLKKNIKRLSDTARQAGQWADRVESTKIGKKSCIYEHCIDTRAYVGEKSRRMQQRRKNLERRKQREIEEQSKLLKNIEKAEPLKITPLAHHAARLVTLEDVSVFYDNRPACTHVSFSIEQGQRLALSGRNGCGKSSLLKLILGEQIPHTGQLQRASGLKISYVPQDTSMLSGSLTEYARSYGIDESLFKTILRKLDFTRIQFEKDMGQYSQGQKKKVLLARSLCEQAHLYIWDEPLNYIDVLSRIQMEELLDTYQPTLLFVEHDAAFLEKIADEILIL